MSRKAGKSAYAREDEDDGDYYDDYDDDDDDEDEDESEDEKGHKEDASKADARARGERSAKTHTKTSAILGSTPKERQIKGSKLNERERDVRGVMTGRSPGVVEGRRAFAFDAPSPDARAMMKREKRTPDARVIEDERGKDASEDARALGEELKAKVRTTEWGKNGAPPAYEASTEEREAYGADSGDVHVVVLGHVDAGKSTLSARVLHALKAVDDRTVSKHARDSKASGKASFAWAWVMDSRPEERERGVTIDVSVKRCILDDSRRLVVLDAPGHCDFVPSAISGVAQADAGALVVDGAVGGFENGFEATAGYVGQTREHARLAKSLGLSTLIVVVNKMDCVSYDAGRFHHIVDVLTRFLVDDVGFGDDQLTFVPVSGIEGSNIAPAGGVSDVPEALASWYKGPSLVDALRAIRLPARGDPKPLRMPIADIITDVRSLGSAACGGKIESGSLVKGQKVMIAPANVEATVKCIEIDGDAVDFAPVGTSVDVGFANLDPQHLQVGSVLCHESYPIPSTTEIEVRVLTTDVVRVPLLRGSKVVLFSHMLACDATIDALVAQLDTLTGAVIKENPRCITRDQSAILRIKTSRAVCVETMDASPTLSRVTLRSGGKTIALGVVTAIWR